MIKSIAIAAATLFAAQPVLGQDCFKPTNKQAVPPKSGLPDGLVARHPASGFSAWLTHPTRAYGHAILGDAIEASGFRLVAKDGRILNYRLGSDAVFEDRQIRLIDLNGDDVPEAIVVKAYLRKGAALAVFGLSNGKIKPIAESPPIGIPNRWLNPAEIADFDGDGELEISYVETPHIGGTLKLYALRGGSLKLQHTYEGVSNHAIGSREMDLSEQVDWNGDGTADIAIPDARRRHVLVISFKDKKPRILSRYFVPNGVKGPVFKARTKHGKPVLVVVNGANQSMAFARSGRIETCRNN